MFEKTAVNGWLCWGALYLLAAGVSLTSETRLLCPQPCRCNTVLLEVNCSDHQLITVPESLPKDTKLLNLTHNKIKTLVQQQFKTLTQLLHLDLSDNDVVMIEFKAFLGLQNLINLNLARNHLKIIPIGAFAGLPKLKSLDISSNEVLVFLDFTFRDLPTLQFLTAVDNDVVFISHQAFTGLTNLQELHLDGCNLSAVPTEALTQLRGLRRLSFQRASLATLPNYSFQHLEHLKELVLSDCPWLETLSGKSLFGLNLTSLTIRHCNLSAVPYIPMHHLVYLVFLDLSFNPITYIHKSQLGDLLRLQELHLVGGLLLRIEIGAFRGLSYLRLLNVTRNLLTTLEMGVFQSVDTLRTLGLDNNPFKCDCRLLWLVQKRPNLDFGGNLPTCTTSVHLQGLNFLDLEDDELSGLLTCRPPRILNRKRQEMRVDQGHTVVFYCAAEGDPAPSVTWLNPKLKPVSPTGRIWALSNGSLEIRFAQPQDSGMYLCLASNAAGNTSLPVNLYVRAFPKSSRNPSSLKGWFVPPGVNGNQKLPFDFKTLLVAATIGFLSFFSSVSVCFIFMFLWSKSKGQIKHTATIAYVPRSAMSGGSGDQQTSRFTMKLI
ncbi:leucine-rich repeat and immunoglobulin-like domain-containing nogo receptor-interacting protein 1 [Cheilinus undulatus]|uniref:leucine-rich repeat and immunoglobulin-like domain-containing nogo receptor-interacting protein 1 n=1 Tax=Cheilinus undulatus TaxID=241271 RepID=UPI001BD5D0A4|nr:leucine-rich repeat and immunoglobulin-like domain-containing nogo receptor-interacting protein 1 [Cheilinus undulatus]XP_041664070.1 leucine-rich repeat and immunoglobulin-like domain-containing nogo receptor-interacting protein 1 [Cheilinus undulatus]XP_041664071.1 leucine-rich repeat and immunoglobulin-like domain-containing nogo receptor-interacting protein 1 [Cheilinus undulatus]XP_041664072.1 leucine-rich repeat and immunoglobulin-like domain-containing nogo receptor-interacting protein